MKFYEINLLSVPKIIFALSVSVDNYRNQFYEKNDYLETAIIESGRIVCENEDKTTSLISPRYTCNIFSDTKSSMRAYCNEPQKHSTVGLSVKYNFTRYDSEKLENINELRSRIKNNNSILLPHQIDLEDDYDVFLSKIKMIVKLYSSLVDTNSIKAISNWFDLCGMYSELVLKKIENSFSDYTPQMNLYVLEAKKYISDNINKKIYVEDISDYLGISKGYLHTIFKNVTGNSITSFINKYKIQIATELIKSRRIPLKDIASCIGIDDPAYMSRIFKKVSNLSYREYINTLK